MLAPTAGQHASTRKEPSCPIQPTLRSPNRGRTCAFTGTDTLRIDNGMLAEYWANADSLLFFQQLGIQAVPALG
jgi:hypothetical protein